MKVFIFENCLHPQNKAQAINYKLLTKAEKRLSSSTKAAAT